MSELISPTGLSDLSSFKNEWSVLLECSSPACNLQRLSERLRSIDWTRLLLLAEEHGVSGHLAARLSEAHEFTIPPGIRQTLLEQQRARNFLTLRLTAELSRLLELFAARGVEALVVKGPVLAMQAYGDPSIRSYSDLDLLVRQRDIRCATELMIACGYHAVVPLSAIDAGKIPGQYLFLKPDSELLVEMHNELTLRYFPRQLPLEEFFARQIRVRLDTYEVPAPCMEDELVLVCVHGAKHFWERLTWIADVAGLISRQTGIDWERAASTATTVQSEHLLHTGLRLAVDVLQAKLPEAISSWVRGDAAAAKLAVQALRWLPAAGYAPPALFERAEFRLRMRGSWLASPFYLLRLSLSPTEDDWQAKGKISHNPLLDALRRPFRLARKYGHLGKNDSL